MNLLTGKPLSTLTSHPVLVFVAAISPSLIPALFFFFFSPQVYINTFSSYSIRDYKLNYFEVFHVNLLIIIFLFQREEKREALILVVRPNQPIVSVVFEERQLFIMALQALRALCLKPMGCFVRVPRCNDIFLLEVSLTHASH